MKYIYNITDNKVVCVSHYAGKAVRGIAKCDPSDEFVEEKGIELSQARCDQKIASKRVNRAKMKVAEAEAMLEAAQKHLEHMRCYFTESVAELHDVEAHLATLEATF